MMILSVTTTLQLDVLWWIMLLVVILMYSMEGLFLLIFVNYANCRYKNLLCLYYYFSLFFYVVMFLVTTCILCYSAVVINLVAVVSAH